jgi:hypothetical protein
MKVLIEIRIAKRMQLVTKVKFSLVKIRIRWITQIDLALLLPLAFSLSLSHVL